MVELYPTRRKTQQWRRTLSRWRLPIVFILILAGVTYHTHQLYVMQDKTKYRIYGLRSFKSKLPQIQFDFPQKEDRLAGQIRESRRLAVRDAFLHAWNGYRTYAFGHDEIRPCTNESHDPFGGWGATLVDSLSTMLVMELQDEFQEARGAVANITFNSTKNGEDISVFETIIRYLGGLISAYELSGDKLMLDKANELGELLLPAFNTTTGMPYHKLNISDVTGVVSLWRNHITYVAEVGTIQLEFFRLSQHTGNPIYARKAQAVTDFLDKMGPSEGKHIKGLYPITINIDSGLFVPSSISFGGCGDSLYEYFLKEYILVDGEIDQYSRMYLESVDAMKKYMISKANNTDLTFIGSLGTSKDLQGHMDHLACFVPGMLAIGAKLFDRPDDLELAKELIETCVFTYANTTTGLGPESFGFNPSTEFYQRRQKEEEEEEKTRNKTEATYMWWSGMPTYNWGYKDDYYIASGAYLLRPETLESLMILYRITGETKYQEYGWNIFQAIERWCKTDVAYSALSNVMAEAVKPAPYSTKGRYYKLIKEEEEEEDEDEEDYIKTNSMESFFMAETLKYLYLLFSPPDIISLDKFVFNTEAHPFMRRAP